MFKLEYVLFENSLGIMVLKRFEISIIVIKIFIAHVVSIDTCNFKITIFYELCCCKTFRTKICTQSKSFESSQKTCAQENNFQ